MESETIFYVFLDSIFALQNLKFPEIVTLSVLKRNSITLGNSTDYERVTLQLYPLEKKTSVLFLCARLIFYFVCKFQLTAPVSMSNISAPSDHQSTSFPWPDLVRISGALRKENKITLRLFLHTLIPISHVFNSSAESMSHYSFLYVFLA